MKIHLVIPMAGEGSRFYKQGYKIPKPMVEIRNRPFFFWAIQSIAKFVEVQDITCIVLEKHIKEHAIDKEIKKYYPDANIIAIPAVLQGPTLTCLEGTKHLQDDLPVLFNDCDHMFCSAALNRSLAEPMLQCEGGLVTFSSNEPQYSYIKFDADGRIIGTIEKQVASSEAICGAYLFKNIQIFREASAKYMEDCEYQEYFLSGVYNSLCKDSAVIKTFPTDFHISFGTPEEYENALDAEEFTVME